MRVTVKNVEASKKKSAKAISKKIEFLEDPEYMQPFGDVFWGGPTQWV